MIRLGLRLAVAGGKEAITRLALIAIAVAIGSGLLLTTLASINAFDAQNSRYAWLETGYPGTDTTASTASSETGADPLWWLLRGDYFHGELIGRVDLAATGPNSPVPPGITALPQAGEFYASPSMAALLRDAPREQLGERYPGTLVGIIGPAALPAPDTLIIVIGRILADLSARRARAPRRPDQHDIAKRVRRRLRTRCRHRLERHDPRALGRGSGVDLSGAHLHRRCDPLVGGPP